MPTRLLLISDTHVPTRAKMLQDAVWRAVDECDLVIHAGDWVAASLLDELESRAPVLGVWGNNDGADLRDRLPEVARASLDGVRVAVVHETGPATGRETRAAAAYPDTDLLVFGHSHIPWDTTAANGLRLLNPGSPTDRRRQPTATMMTLAVADGRIGNVTLAEL